MPKHSDCLGVTKPNFPLVEALACREAEAIEDSRRRFAGFAMRQRQDQPPCRKRWVYVCDSRNLN